MKDKQEAQMTPEMAAAQWSLAYRESEEFRAAFDKDPKAALAELTGQEVPEDVEVVVHRRKAGQVHVVIPDEIPGISDEQLGGISGGDYFGGGGHDGHAPAPGDMSWRYDPPGEICPRSGLLMGTEWHDAWLERNP